MAGLFDNIVKGLATLAPSDDPDVMLFRAQSELKELSEKEEAVYAGLGRRLYAAGGSDLYPETAVALSGIEASREAAKRRLDQLQAEKASREQVEADRRAAELAEEERRTCPECGNVNPEGSKFCQECGCKMPVALFCPSCGAQLKPGSRFCGECGAKAQ